MSRTSFLLPHRNKVLMRVSFDSVGKGAHFEGVLLAKRFVTLQTGSSMNGRILSQTEVALQKATVNSPAVPAPEVIEKRSSPRQWL